MSEKPWDKWIIRGVSITATKRVFIYSVDGYSNGAFAILDQSFGDKDKETQEKELKSMHASLSEQNRKNNYVPLK